MYICKHYPPIAGCEECMLDRIVRLEEDYDLLKQVHVRGCKKVTAYLDRHALGLVGDDIFDVIVEDAESLRKLVSDAMAILSQKS